MAELLEVAQLVEQHGVAQVQVRRGRVEPDLDPQLRPVASLRASSSSTISSSEPRRMVSIACWCVDIWVLRGMRTLLHFRRHLNNKEF